MVKKMEGEKVVAGCNVTAHIVEKVSRKTGKPFYVLQIVYDNGIVVDAGFATNEIYYSMLAFCKNAE